MRLGLYIYVVYDRLKGWNTDWCCRTTIEEAEPKRQWKVKTTELFWDSFGLFRFLYILKNGDRVYSEIGFIAVEWGAGIK